VADSPHDGPDDAEAIWVVQLFFPIGLLVATPAALDALAKAGDHIETFLTRHCLCDWGELDPFDWEQNEIALKTGRRLLSAYTLLDGEKLWIITESDRSSTTILLPSDY